MRGSTRSVLSEVLPVILSLALLVAVEYYVVIEVPVYAELAQMDEEGAWTPNGGP